MLKRVIAFFRGGTSSFSEAEKRILSCVIDALPATDGELLRQQIEAVDLVQRPHPGRLVCAYYNNVKAVAQLPYLGSEHCLAKVSYRSRGKTRATFLVLHDGRFMSFERSVPKTATEVDSIDRVVLHPDGFKGVAEEINAEEHGNTE